MPKFTIDLPESIMPALTRKAEGWKQTPESFLASYVSICLENDEQSAADPAREALEDVLEERDKGPFIRITDMKALKEEVMAKVRERLQQSSSHA